MKPRCNMIRFSPCPWAWWAAPAPNSASATSPKRGRRLGSAQSLARLAVSGRPSHLRPDAGSGRPAWRRPPRNIGGADPRVCHGLALRKLGREAEGRAVLADVVRQMSRAPKFAREAEAEWSPWLRPHCAPERRTQFPLEICGNCVRPQAFICANNKPNGVRPVDFVMAGLLVLALRALDFVPPLKTWTPAKVGAPAA